MFRSKLTRSVTAFGFCLGLSLAAATAAAYTVGNPQGKYQDPGISDTEIVIGLHAPLSGRAKAFGADALDAAKMWYKMINDRGGIWGRKIRVVVADDKCSPNDLVAVVKKMVTVDKVFIVHGGSCTHATVAAQEYITREKVPFVMLNAAGDAAVFPPTRYTFGAFGGTQRTVGGSLIDFVTSKLGAKKIAYIAHDDDFGASNFLAAKWAADQNGATFVTDQRVSRKIVDVTAPMLKVRASGADVLVITTYTGPAALIVKKAHEFGIKMPIVAAVQAVPNLGAFIKNVGTKDAFKNFYYGSPLNDLTQGPKQQWIIDMFKANYDGRNPSPFMAYGVPSAMAVAQALHNAGPNPTRESFVDALAALNFNTGILAGPIEFGKNKRDGHNASIFLKFDGTNTSRVPGIFYNRMPLK